MNGYQNFGMLLHTLSAMSDMEGQLVAQVEHPGQFVPDMLVAQWYRYYTEGQIVRDFHLSEAIFAALAEFDEQLSALLDHLADDADDRASFILSDQTWSLIREMAEITLIQISELIVPDEPLFGAN